MTRNTQAAHLADLFPTDHPVPDRMIGRGAEVPELATSLAQGLHQVVAGTRRAGKTTVCLAALRRLEEGRDCYTVEVDLFRLGGLGALARAVVAGLVSNRTGVHRGASSARAAVRKDAGLAGALASAKLKTAWGADVEIAFDLSLSEHDPRGAFEKALVLLQSVAEADQRHVVLFLDEFQEVAGLRHLFGDPDEVTQLMRSVLQGSPSVTCLFAGSITHLVRDLFTDDRRAFYKFGAWHELYPIADDEWSSGLAERFELGHRPIDPVALRYLLDQSEGHVRTTMLLAQQSFLAALLAGDSRVTAEHTAAAFEMAMAAEAAGLAKDVERLRETGRHTFGVCQAIALGEPPYKRGRPAAVLLAIEALQRLGVVEQRGNPGRGGWAVADPLLRRYLSRLAS